MTIAILCIYVGLLWGVLVAWIFSTGEEKAGQDADKPDSP